MFQITYLSLSSYLRTVGLLTRVGFCMEHRFILSLTMHDPIIFLLVHGMAYTSCFGQRSMMYVPLEAGIDQRKLEYKSY